MSGLAKRVSVSEGINRYPPQTHHTQCLASKDNRDQIERTIIVIIIINYNDNHTQRLALKDNTWSRLSNIKQPLYEVGRHI